MNGDKADQARERLYQSTKQFGRFGVILMIAGIILVSVSSDGRPVGIGFFAAGAMFWMIAGFLRGYYLG